MTIVSGALIWALLIGTFLQLVMVFAGHSNPAVARKFAALGTGISLLAGLIYTLMAAPIPAGAAAVGGLIAGGLCALIGIGVSFYLKDVPASVLGFGTAMSALAGALGGWMGSLFA
jgi:hypothetical protein